MFTLVNDFSAAQFVTINVDGTVTSSSYVAAVGSSRFHNFYVSQLYRQLIQLSVGTWIPRDVACVF